MIAGKHFDPVLGLDIHIILIPTPAGPVPTPLPHPYVGFVLDVFDYLPIVGATVLVNGLPRAQAGSAGFELPKHIPMGGMFQKPPTFESEMFMGSSSVSIDGEPFSYTALPVLSCQDIGMPAPIRPKKKSTAKSMMLPLTMLLAIPMGAPVLVGGAPTISFTALAMKAGLSVLGKGLKKLRKLQKGSRRMKALSDKLHNQADALCNKLGLGDAARARVHKGVCTVTGHPVDIATGKVFTEQLDFELPGPLPFKLERTWYSTSTYRGPLGHGWHHSYDLALHVADELLLLRTADGRHVGFPRLAPGESHLDPRERCTLFCTGLDQYRLRAADGLDYLFASRPARAGRHPEHVAHSRELRLAFVRTRSGHQLEFERDAQGLLTRIIDSAGRVLEVESDAEGRMRSLRAPHPERAGQRVTVAEYRYDARGDLIEVRDALGAPRRFQYKDHLLVRETDRCGLSFYFEYDGQDERAQCTRTWGDGGIYDHKLSYDPITSVTCVENSLGHKTLYQHAEGQVVRKVDPLGATSRIAFDEHGRPLSETDANGLTTAYAYDARGNLRQTVLPGGAKTATEYNQDDLLVGLTTAVGGHWSFEYDEFGRTRSRTDPLGRQTRHWYSGQGLLVGITDPEDHATAFGYDAQLNLGALTTPDHVATRFVCDGWGRVTEVVDGAGNSQRRRYDLVGRVERIDEPDGNIRSYGYDAEGRLLHARDAQREVELAYQGTGRLAYRTEAGATVRFEYDTEEQLIAIQNEHGHLYTFALDARGLVDVETGFGGERRAFKRDLGGRVREVERPGGLRSKYDYDSGSRISKIEHSDGSKETFKYRQDGALIEATNATTSVRFERDVMGRVVREASGGHWVESRFAATGLRDEARSSLGHVQRISRNVMGDVTRVEAEGGFHAEFTRDAFGLELERRMAGGARARWKRDSLGRGLEHELANSAGSLRARSYTWEVGQRLRGVIDAMQGPIHYDHDAAGQLARARYADGSVDTRLPDAVGNLFQREDRRDRSYGAGGELLEARGPAGTTHYRYDAEGNLVEKQEPDARVWRYTWDAAGTLARVTRPDGSEVSFSYDALGRRLRKTMGATSTCWVWDGNVPLHEWTENDRSQAPPNGQEESGPPVTWLFEPESYAPLAKLHGDQPCAVITDHLGTPVRMLDAQGDEVWAAEIDTLGALRDVRGDAQACPFRWPGQYQDEETGLSYNRFRYYDPETGRYASQDPIRLWGGMQLYAYPFDPLAAFDPLGLIPVYRLLRPDEDPSQGLNAKKPGRDMTVHGHVTSGSRNKGSQFISTSTDPDALTPWREPGQRMVTFDTDDVVPDAVGNRRVVDISTRERAIAAGVGSGSANIPARSREVLVEGHVPPQAIRPCP